MTGHARIRWAPMLPSSKLVQLYQQNASGVIDDELVDDVGWRLWERLADVIRVSQGRVRCPICATDFHVRTPTGDLDDAVWCPTLDWCVTPRAWHQTWEHRDLNGNCVEFERYVTAWPSARSTRDRMLLIDAVVHALHVSARDDLLGNFAARNFIEGSRPKVVALLDELANGPGSHIAEGARARWAEARAAYRSRYRR